MPDQGCWQEESPERPTLTIAQVYALADAVGQRCCALILLAMFSSLRWGELGGLRRCDIDLAARTVRMTRQLNEVSGDGFDFGPPKSRAGKETGQQAPGRGVHHQAIGHETGSKPLEAHQREPGNHS